MKALVIALLLCAACASQKAAIPSPSPDAAVCLPCAPEPEIRVSSSVQVTECPLGGHCVQGKGEKFCASACPH